MTATEKISLIGTAVAILTPMVLLGTFIKAIVEYQRQNAVKRFEIFQSMNKRFDDKEFSDLRELLDNDSDQLEFTSYTKKHNFVGFFEELALSVKSKIMSEEVAFYLFGYYAIRCWKSDNFWKGDKMINKDSIYWALFRDFALRMENMEGHLGSGGLDPSKMKF